MYREFGGRGYLLTPASASITPDKDTVTRPSQSTTSATNPEPIIAPALDVRADFADSCQIGRSGDRWFLLMVDKTTEYVNFIQHQDTVKPTSVAQGISYIHRQKNSIPPYG
jgi:hypothetical protein